ncbi:MAG: ABC transporter ATP-binding protein [Isosphaeraceae bacterium]|nr:ABC transporter ATP-binding protein [Isosphaeraceae bacterium]
MSDHPAIQVERLRYRYPDGREALRGLDFRIESGERVALVGPNGAGKSTLLLHLNGILPGEDRRSSLHSHTHTHTRTTEDERSTRGEPAIRIGGLAIVDRNLPEIRRRVGLLFQDPDDQLFCTSVIEDVAFGPLNLGVSRSEARRIAIECLERVSLAEHADRAPHHLSFGERKRACLAGILACRPAILVLDEPTANLDPRGRRRFMALIAELDATILIATHDLEMVLELCPRTILLDQGRVVADGPSPRLLSDQDLLEAHGLEIPYSLRSRL